MRISGLKIASWSSASRWVERTESHHLYTEAQMRVSQERNPSFALDSSQRASATHEPRRFHDHLRRNVHPACELDSERHWTLALWQRLEYKPIAECPIAV